MCGRERDDNNSRLNSFKRVHLGNRSAESEASWVLFDKNDPRHASIPRDINRAEDLPHGALVISVDMSPLSGAEEQFLKNHMAQYGDKLDIPPQGHVIYITGRENQVMPLRKTLTRTIDRRSHADEPMSRDNTRHGVSVLMDMPPQEEHHDNYHFNITGNNHPKKPGSRQPGG